jgi:LAO/AO transport system kinase
MPVPITEIIAGVEAGDRRATARAISIVEDSRPGKAELLAALFGRGNGTYICGITGPSGAGKSTLVDQLARNSLEDGESIGIICVDPTSPFSGGALLGDRIRMHSIATDPGVFIRSMATRGSRGGLARSAREVVTILGATGTDRIIVETVGVGQIELDIAEAADTTVVVLVPESGDGIQAMKAGLMEIGDIFVINKADRDGAAGLRLEIESILALRQGRARPPTVLTTIASRGEGITELAEAITGHRQWLDESGEGQRRRKRRIETYVKEIVQEAVMTGLWDEGGFERRLETEIDRIIDGRTDPFTVAREIMDAGGLAIPGGKSSD